MDRLPKQTWNATQFALAFVDLLTKELAVALSTAGDANGAFVIAALAEELVRTDGEQASGEEKGGAEAARSKLKEWFGAKERELVEKGVAKGKKVLLENLAAL